VGQAPELLRALRDGAVTARRCPASCGGRPVPGWEELAREGMAATQLADRLEAETPVMAALEAALSAEDEGGVVSALAMAATLRPPLLDVELVEDAASWVEQRSGQRSSVRDQMEELQSSGGGGGGGGGGGMASVVGAAERHLDVAAKVAASAELSREMTELMEAQAALQARGGGTTSAS
jgi:hypothetical protein